MPRRIHSRAAKMLGFLFAALVALPLQAQDSLPAFERPNGALLRPGVLTYQIQLLHADGRVTALGNRSVAVTEQVLGGLPSWLIVESRTGTVLPTLDSVAVTKGDLTPERWVGVIGSAQLAVSFTRDSAFGVIQSYQGRSSFVAGIPRNVLLSASSTERLLELLPLRDGYRASATMFVVGGPSPTLLPAEINVERQEDVESGGRRVRAWRIALRSGALEARYWVALDGTRVVRTEQALPEGVMVSTLLR